MHIAYIGHTRFPTEKAHGHQIAQVCSSMKKLGHEVTLVTPNVKTPIKESPFEYYGVFESFCWIRLASFDALSAWWVPNPFAFMISMWSYRKKIRSFLHNNSFDLLYCRSHAILSTMLSDGTPVILELHVLPRFRRSAFVRLCNGCTKVVCLTSPMRLKLLSYGVDASRIVVEGDAVELSRFKNMPTSNIAKAQYTLPVDRIIIGYVGRLKTMNMEKGVLHLLNAISVLKKQGKQVFGFIVGGPENDQKAYENEATQLGLDASDVFFTGSLPSDQIPFALAACDILAMPFPDFTHYRENMSPLKMFEYMAARKPIVTSDLPTIRDVLNEETAFFCKSGDSENLADVLNIVIDDKSSAQRIADNAHHLVQGHTWEKRMTRIISSMH